MPSLRVRTKRGDVVDVAATDVVAVKALTDAPVRTGDIRNLEHAAALAWPGVEQQWLDGWLLRYGHGSTRRANSAVPLEVTRRSECAARDRRLVRGPRQRRRWSRCPDRLFRVPAGVPVDGENVVMTRRLDARRAGHPGVTLAARPDDGGCAIYRRDVPVDVLTAVIDGEVVFANRADAAVGRAAVTSAPDGTRWAGLSAVHVARGAPPQGSRPRTVRRAAGVGGRARRHPRVRAGARRQRRRRIALYEAMGFATQHHVRVRRRP